MYFLSFQRATIAFFAFVNAIMLLKEAVSEIPRQISGLKWQDSWEPLFQGQINGLKSLHVAFLVYLLLNILFQRTQHTYLLPEIDSVVHVLRERQ